LINFIKKNPENKKYVKINLEKVDMKLLYKDKQKLKTFKKDISLFHDQIDFLNKFAIFLAFKINSVDYSYDYFQNFFNNLYLLKFLFSEGVIDKKILSKVKSFLKKFGKIDSLELFNDTDSFILVYFSKLNIKNKVYSQLRFDGFFIENIRFIPFLDNQK
jgi:hypothetical protein